jgi:hypothetical protein
MCVCPNWRSGKTPVVASWYWNEMSVQIEYHWCFDGNETFISANISNPLHQSAGDSKIFGQLFEWHVSKWEMPSEYPL